LELTAPEESAPVDNYVLATEWTPSFSFNTWHVGASCDVTVHHRQGWLILVCLPCRCSTQLEAVSSKITLASSFAPRQIS